MKSSFLLFFGFFALSCSNTNEQIEHLHYNSVLIDTHNDISSAGVVEGAHLEHDLTGKFHSDLDRFQKGGVDIQVFSIWMSGDYGNGTAFKYAKRQIDSLRGTMFRNYNRTTWVTESAQIDSAVKQKKLGIMLGVEGGHVLEDRLDLVDSLRDLGVRYITLTWNNSTSWASSAADETDTTKTLAQKGLSDFGKNVVKRMNDLGVIVDVSHAGEQTFYDALAASTKPVIASHSSVYAICPVPRNLKDEQILAIGKNGGAIFVNFYSGFLDKSYAEKFKQFKMRHQTEVDSLTATGMSSYGVDDFLSNKYASEVQSIKAPVSLLVDHIDHIVKLIGVDHVGLGADYDGIESPPKDMDDVSTYPVLTHALHERGYNVNDIKKILGGNFIRVLKANEN